MGEEYNTRFFPATFGAGKSAILMKFLLLNEVVYMMNFLPPRSSITTGSSAPSDSNFPGLAHWAPSRLEEW
ncbi:hypothetical protein CQB05_15700 [Paracidovorax citrulli]|nr:hypothetical protein CQB05_15700 [Paracidovorax citrulli]